MYHIVGSDNQPHGPIDAATLNQWITEGRANGQTMTRLDGSQEWKPLATFSEFAPALVAAPPSPAGGGIVGGCFPVPFPSLGWNFPAAAATWAWNAIEKMYMIQVGEKV